jgi:hypothetical protein
MKRKPRDFEISSLSFLDVISCGFGAIVLLVLISNNAEAPSADDSNIAQQLLTLVLRMETANDSLSIETDAVEKARRSRELLLDRLLLATAQATATLEQTQRDANELENGLKALALVLSAPKRAAISQDTAEIRDDEVGGIPVDSDYVVFIIDTSGSMQVIWDRVIAELENVINIHPKMEGFQVLNDNGSHLISAYAGKWIPDTKRRRDNIINLLRSWNSASNSSPVEGLEVALKRYAKPNTSVSIYIFGDDYTGSSYDPVINALVNLNANRVTGERLAKIHAVGFFSPYSTSRFAILMREVTRRNGGTFVALPW